MTIESRRSWPSVRLPLPAVPEQARARLLLVGGHLIAMANGVAVIAKGNAIWALAPEGGGPAARIRLRAAEERDLEGETALSPATTEPTAPTAPSHEDEALAAARTLGQMIGIKIADWAVEGVRADVQSALARAIGRLEKRAAAVRGDLARIGDADAMAAQASWFVAAASRAPRGATSLEVTDWTSGEARPLIVKLDPAKPAREQVDAMFHRAKRLKKGGAIATERLRETDVQLASLRAIQEELGDEVRSADLSALTTLAARARAAAPRDVKLDITREGGEPSAPRGRRGLQEAAPPYRTFVREDGTRLLVGRGAEKNDRLTFQVARPHDLWLHAKGRTGAHVIVPLSKPGSKAAAKSSRVPGDVLADAALLAAHFSDARDEAVVDVEYTARKYLKKPRGGAPGTVVIEREKVLALRMDPARRKSLLEREEA